MLAILSLSLSSLYPSHFSFLLSFLLSSSGGAAARRGRVSAREERRPGALAQEERRPGRGAQARGQLAATAAVGFAERRRRRSWPWEPAAAGAGRRSRRASPDPPSSCLAGAPRSGGGAPRSGGAQGGTTAPDPVELEEALHGVRRSSRRRSMAVTELMRRCEHSSGRVPAGDGRQGGGAAVDDVGLLPLPPAAATPAWICAPAAPVEQAAPPQADCRTGLFFLFAKNALVPVGLSNRVPMDA